MKIDNFALTMFQTCPAKYHLRMIQGWTSRKRSAALGFGGAIHEGLAEWYRTHELDKALYAIDAAWPDNIPTEDWRDKVKAMDTMVKYVREYPSENFQIVGMPDSPMVERTFTLETGLFLPCPECDPAGMHMNEIEDPANPLCPNCNNPLEPIEYGGIFDGLIEFGGAVYVLEHKTTTEMLVDKTKVPFKFFSKFRPNNQVTGYVWGSSKLSGLRVGGAMINGIGLFKASATRFERHLTSRTEAEIQEWLQFVHRTCIAIQQTKLSGVWPFYTESCTHYGLCEFHSVHSLPHDLERGKMLQMEYVQNPWDYEDRDDVAGGQQ